MAEPNARHALAVALLTFAAHGLACSGGHQPGSSPAPAAPPVASQAASRPQSAAAGAVPRGQAAARSDAATPTAAVPPEAPAGLDLDRSPRITLAPGLTVVNAVAEETGDYEVVMRISARNADRLRVSYSATLPVAGTPTELHGERIVLARDLQSARIYRVRWLSGRTELARGTTALGVSKEVFDEVRTHGRSECSLASLEQVGTAIGALGLPSPEYEGVLERVEAGAVPVPVIVDGRREWLPSIHAKGTFDGLTGDVNAEFWFLDEADNPLTLRAVIGTGRLVVVRIDRAPQEADSRLEKALAAEESVELAGIYFEFASAKLRPESDAAIADAASVLRRHPTWRVRLEGHTDAIGSAEANLALSRARAEAVRQAIANSVGGGDRLEAAGFGPTRPRESNDTPEGRAMNRRVEMVRVH